MKPSHTRLTCRAHNRFSPSIVLWQHFVSPDRPCLAQLRLSSTTSGATKDGPNEQDGISHPQESNEPTQREAENPHKENVQSNPPRLRLRKPRATKGSDKWHDNKVDASVAKNLRTRYNAQKAEMSASGQLLATARAAFKTGEDYTGVVVRPIITPGSPNIPPNLPWSLPQDERHMGGIDRLAIEIERFHDFARPNEIEALARATIINQVRQDVQATLPNHDVEVFGSERTGLAMATSDIDFRLLKKDQIGESALSGIPPEPKKRIQGLKALQNLQNNGFARHKLYPISMLRYARYPLISLQDRHSGLDLQVVLSNDTSLSRKFIQGYIEQYPYLRAVYFVVKTTFDIRGLSDVFRGGFGSYTLFMMLVASIQQKPHSRNDAAGCLINFLGFYHDFNTTLHGLSVNPPAVFDKADTAIMPGKVKSKLKTGATKPLPPYMLSLRDPADETNDLGRKALCIKHVQTTFAKLGADLARDVRMNTRASLLTEFVGPSYLIYKERRRKLRQYGSDVMEQNKMGLAEKARMVRERRNAEEAERKERGFAEEVPVVQEGFV